MLFHLWPLKPADISGWNRVDELARPARKQSSIQFHFHQKRPKGSLTQLVVVVEAEDVDEPRVPGPDKSGVRARPDRVHHDGLLPAFAQSHWLRGEEVVRAFAASPVREELRDAAQLALLRAAASVDLALGRQADEMVRSRGYLGHRDALHDGHWELLGPCGVEAHWSMRILR